MAHINSPRKFNSSTVRPWKMVVGKTFAFPIWGPGVSFFLRGEVFVKLREGKMRFQLWDLGILATSQTKKTKTNLPVWLHLGICHLITLKIYEVLESTVRHIPQKTSRIFIVSSLDMGHGSKKNHSFLSFFSAGVERAPRCRGVKPSSNCLRWSCKGSNEATGGAEHRAVGESLPNSGKTTRIYRHLKLHFPQKKRILCRKTSASVWLL